MDRNPRVALVAQLAVEAEPQMDRSVRAPWEREAYQIYLPVEYLAGMEVVLEAVDWRLDLLSRGR